MITRLTNVPKKFFRKDFLVAQVKTLSFHHRIFFASKKRTPVNSFYEIPELLLLTSGRELYHHHHHRRRQLRKSREEFLFTFHTVTW